MFSFLVVIVLLFAAQTCWSLPISTNINSLSISELNQYRDCVRRGLDTGAYIQVAGEHGVPMGLCPHGNLHFLPWHRHHITSLENNLNCTVPYWDWARDPIPVAFLEATYTDAEGRVWPNPLKLGVRPHSSHKNRSIVVRFPTSDLQAGQDLALSRSDLISFSSSLEDAHNLVHVSIGGDMSDIDYASYDPIFYSHHKNVDRLWFLWQTSPARNGSWLSPLINDYVRTADGLVSSIQIANDLSPWLSPVPVNTTQQSTSIPGSGPVLPSAPPSTSSLPNVTAASGLFLPTSMSDVSQPLSTALNNMTAGVMPSFTSLSNEPVLLVPSWTDIVMGPVQRPSASSHATLAGPGSVARSWYSAESGPVSVMTWRNIAMVNAEPKQHILLKIPDVKSTVEGYRLNVILDGECIGLIGLLGMGRTTSMMMPMMVYKKDRLLDVTCHLETLNNLTYAHNGIRFELFDDQQRMVARPRLDFTLFYEYF